MAPEKKRVTVDVDEFVRTRDALTTAFLSLSSSVDKAVKAYIEHTNAVLAGDASLNVSYLTQPFNVLGAAAGVVHQTGEALAKSTAKAVEPPAADAATGGADEDDGKGKKRKRSYKARDPNAPKRPLTAYFRYLSEMRPLLTIELAKNIGTHKPGELSQVATERWRKLSEDEKKPYHDAYKAAKDVYDQDVQDYKARTGQLVADDDDEEDDIAVAPAVIIAHEDENDSDDEASSDESPPPPPPKVKKSSSPEAVKKTPKAAAATAAVDKTPKTTSKKATATPMFNSINPAPAGTDKKRKAAAGDDATPKKKRGRPSNADKLLREQAAAAAAAKDNDDSSSEEEQPKKEKKEKPKKKKTAEA
ncbi:hypothetical protein AMS68_002951 [Peltaster fructicola]|uniref:HMG box domain-containing protein n=1 Tax=Peltaster fructicola TaxID=286661 RepID=A0A6H0XRS3_9PEZI|nr:hypothetical protein AMS68_002951 [Peltaster fructicola]